MTDGRPQRSPGELDRLFVTYRDTGERGVRNELVEAHQGLAASIANDYRGSGASSSTTWCRSPCSA